MAVNDSRVKSRSLRAAGSESVGEAVSAADKPDELEDPHEIIEPERASEVYLGFGRRQRLFRRVSLVEPVIDGAVRLWWWRVWVVEYSPKFVFDL